MINLILIVILAGILGSVFYYLYKAKKNGQHCIGCPNSKQCGGACCGCHAHAPQAKEHH